MIGPEPTPFTFRHFQGLYVTNIPTKLYYSLNMTCMFPVLHLYSQHSFCLPCLPHLHLFTYSMNTIEHLSCVRPYAYQGITLTLCCLESACRNPMTAIRLVHIATASINSSWPEVTTWSLYCLSHSWCLSVPDASHSFLKALILAVLSAPRALPRLLIVRSFTYLIFCSNLTSSGSVL